jgi:hypothetical protein
MSCGMIRPLVSYRRKICGTFTFALPQTALYLCATRFIDTVLMADFALAGDANLGFSATIL